MLFCTTLAGGGCSAPEIMCSNAAESSCGFYWALLQLAWCPSNRLVCEVTGLALEFSSAVSGEGE